MTRKTVRRQPARRLPYPTRMPQRDMQTSVVAPHNDSPLTLAYGPQRQMQNDSRHDINQQVSGNNDNAQPEPSQSSVSPWSVGRLERIYHADSPHHRNSSGSSGASTASAGGALSITEALARQDADPAWTGIAPRRNSIPLQPSTEQVQAMQQYLAWLDSRPELRMAQTTNRQEQAEVSFTGESFRFPMPPSPPPPPAIRAASYPTRRSQGPIYQQETETILSPYDRAQHYDHQQVIETILPPYNDEHYYNPRRAAETMLPLYDDAQHYDHRQSYHVRLSELSDSSEEWHDSRRDHQHRRSGRHQQSAQQHDRRY